jgi:hypothetical protein
MSNLHLSHPKGGVVYENQPSMALCQVCIRGLCRPYKVGLHYKQLLEAAIWILLGGSSLQERMSMLLLLLNMEVGMHHRQLLKVAIWMLLRD